jgi:hypothetical protein
MGKKLVNDSTTLHQILDAVSAKTTAQLDQKKEKARLKENYLQRKLVTKQEREKEKEQKIVRNPIHSIDKCVHLNRRI